MDKIEETLEEIIKMEEQARGDLLDSAPGSGTERDGASSDQYQSARSSAFNESQMSESWRV